MAMMLVLVALGVLCVAYGLLCAVLYPAGGFFAVWLVGGALLLLGAWARGTGRWERLDRWARRATCGVFAAVVVALAACGGAIMGQAGGTPPDGLDYLIVLGAGLNSDGTPREALRMRLDAAASYLEENPGTVCIVTGAQGGSEPVSEARSMRDYLVGAGVDESRIVLEERATNTAENLALSRDLMDSPEASVGVVTNDFHLCRALLMARRAGLTGAQGISAPSNLLYLPQALLRECFALGWAWLVGTV